MAATTTTITITRVLLLPLLVLDVTLVLCRPAAKLGPTSPNLSGIPAIFVFGDSIVDAGNNNNLTTVVKCNFGPYGKDFNGGVPTGRFSNGKVPSDLIAEAMGIKDLVPAYLDPDLKPEDLVTGVTFASGGSGYDWLTPKLVSVISLPEQLENLKEYIGKVKKVVGEEKASSVLTKALFLVVAGSNDIANTYFVRKMQYDVDDYTQLMSDSASQFVQELYGLGARKIGVFSAPPVGCVPAQITLAGGDNRTCAENHNKAALLFNAKLSRDLDSLAQTLPDDARIVYIDVYNPLLHLIQNPQHYGLEYVTEGCCGSGDIEVGILCNRYLPVCSDASKYVFFDSYHPTEQAYRALLTPLITKYLPKFL